MRWSPLTPHLPRYPGPYNVGTVELELPVPTPLQRTFGDCTVKTLLVRLFYPTDAKKGRSPRWVGHNGVIARGYAQFLGVSPRLLSVVTHLGLNYTELPAYIDAPLASAAAAAAAAPSSTAGAATASGNEAQGVVPGRWPCMIFSHGLGGTRNAYSQICGSLASGGSVVCAVEHRDNSAAVSVVNDEEVVEYVSIKETTPETIAKRRHQLAQRAYEYRLAIELVRSLNAEGNTLWKLDDFAGPMPYLQDDTSLIAQFAGKLDCLGQRRFVAVGHSFGAATAVYSCKDKETIVPGFAETPLRDELRAAVLLDPWMQVLEDSRGVHLTVPSIAIASEAFQKWTSNWLDVKHLLTPVSDTSYSNTPSNDGSLADQTKRNKLYHLVGSAHLSQSDFQLLFPTATKFAFKAAISPQLAMDLNVRVVRAWLRQTTGIGAGANGHGEDVELFDGRYKDVLIEEPLT